MFKILLRVIGPSDICRRPCCMHFQKSRYLGRLQGFITTKNRSPYIPSFYTTCPTPLPCPTLHLFLPPWFSYVALEFSRPWISAPGDKCKYHCGQLCSMI